MAVLFPPHAVPVAVDAVTPHEIDTLTVDDTGLEHPLAEELNTLHA